MGCSGFNADANQDQGNPSLQWCLVEDFRQMALKNISLALGLQRIGYFVASLSPSGSLEKKHQTLEISELVLLQKALIFIL